MYPEHLRFDYEWTQEEDELRYICDKYSTAERDLTLDAASISVPVEHPGLDRYGHPIEFLWGIYDDDLNTKHQWEASEALRRLEFSQIFMEQVTGTAKSYLVCLRAQLLEMAGEWIHAARLYETLTDADSPMPVFKVQMMAREKAALLYMKCVQPDDAIRILNEACASDPDVPSLREALARAYIRKGDLSKAQRAARCAASIREKAGMTPDISFLLNQTERIEEAEIEREITKYDYFPLLTNLSKGELRFAIENSLKAKNSARALTDHAGYAALCFSKVVELELREVIFRAWREGVSAQDRQCVLLKKVDPILSTFLMSKGDPALGEMITSMRKSLDSQLSVLRSLARFIRRRNPNLLDPKVMREFEDLRDAGNFKRHSELSHDLAVAIPAKAKRCISAIHPVVFATS
jgi:hypothetical protein